MNIGENDQISEYVIREADIVLGDTEAVLYKNMPTVISRSPHYHSHSFYELHFASAGGCVRTGKATVTVSSNDMLIIPPNTVHYTFCPDDGETHTTVMAMTLTKRDSGYKCFSRFKSGLDSFAMRPVPVGAESVNDIVEIYRLFSDDSIHARCIVKARAYAFAVWLFELTGGFDGGSDKDGTPESGDTDILLDNLVVDPNCSIEVIANRTGYSERHVERLIRERYGDSLRAIRKRNNCLNAMRMMADSPEKTESEIAVSAGFTDVRAMRRALSLFGSDTSENDNHNKTEEKS